MTLYEKESNRIYIYIFIQSDQSSVRHSLLMKVLTFSTFLFMILKFFSSFIFSSRHQFFTIPEVFQRSYYNNGNILYRIFRSRRTRHIGINYVLRRNARILQYLTEKINIQV